ncbi:cytochrome b/b6 domain-containing protein [Limnohabitans sp. DCL3]|uniref:cytochrome b/b6 domain-containing protein n=1 Tax=Limnohabitans sp. DCL3 TaxID=3374103 RepID=UPI003A8364E5
MFTLRIWDLPTRLFHWALAACVLGLIITGKWGGNAMAWHFRFGYGVLVLLSFRLFWGFWGGFWSRWTQLPLSPREVWPYLKGRTSEHAFPGHNPLGSWSILAMLLVLAFQVSTGLISDDEIANAGPLTALVSGEWVSWATSWHKQWGQWLVFFLVALHLLALLWYRLRKKLSLVPAMVHGHKSLPVLVQESQDRRWQRIFAILLLSLSCAGVWTLLSFGP